MVSPTASPYPMKKSQPLLDHFDAFVAFVRYRTRDPELALDLVQDCLLKALKSDNTPDDEDGLVPWFYRILRHAIIDAHRRSVVRKKTLEGYALELPETASTEDEKAICQCVLKLLPAMPSADAELLRRIDLEGESASDFARAKNRRINTVNVRLWRARRRLRDELQRLCRTCATHGCLDCDCADQTSTPNQ